MSWEFGAAVAAIVLTAIIGLPIGHAMLASSIFYLLLQGQDLSIAFEQMLTGLYGSYVLLAIPLFIFAADLMNVGSLSDRLLDFCRALVGRFRGGEPDRRRAAGAGALRQPRARGAADPGPIHLR